MALATSATARPSSNTNMSDTAIGGMPVEPGREVDSTRPRVSKSPFRVQTLRGLACVLLVAFHVIGSHATRDCVS